MKKRLHLMGYTVVSSIAILSLVYAYHQHQLALYQDLEYECSEQLTHSQSQVQAARELVKEYHQLFPDSFIKAMVIDDSHLKEYSALMEE